MPENPKKSSYSSFLALTTLLALWSYNGWKGFCKNDLDKGSIRCKVNGFYPSFICNKSLRNCAILTENSLSKSMK